MMSSLIRRAVTLITFVVAGLLFLTAGAQAYELRLVRAIDGNFGTTAADDICACAADGSVFPGVIISYDVYLDTQGESGIVLFSAGLGFDPSFLQYRPDLSQAEDYYPLYAPSPGKGLPPTWLEPQQNPFELWSGRPPVSGNDVVMINFLAHNFNETVATATNLYLGTVTFELTGPGGMRIDWGFDAVPGAHTFNVGGVEMSDQVSTPVVWAPEPSTALLFGTGLAALGALRRRH